MTRLIENANFRKKNMKPIHQALFAAVMVATLSVAGTAQAQFKVNEPDGIAASPRMRQALNERQASVKATSPCCAKPTPSTIASAGDQIAASPRLRQQLNEARKTTIAPSSTTTVGYRATGKDGLTASPRLRQQLDENPTTIQVAPVK
jgi:hypothetical protein